MGNFNVHSLRKLQRMHQLINLKARVKNEDEWFQNKENIEPPHNTCLPLDENASQECRQLLKTKAMAKSYSSHPLLWLTLRPYLVTNGLALVQLRCLFDLSMISHQLRVF